VLEIYDHADMPCIPKPEHLRTIGQMAAFQQLGEANNVVRGVVN
jgi:hypothetical protein